jgi:hypothetical protein
LELSQAIDISLLCRHLQREHVADADGFTRPTTTDGNLDLLAGSQELFEL